MKIQTLAGATLAAALFALPAFAAQAPRDAFGRSVPIGEGRPALVFYSNEDTREVMEQHAFAMSYELREEKPIVVVRVDLRGVPGMFKGMARKEVRKAHRESVAAMEQVFRDNGMEPPTKEIDQSLYMVPDFGGRIHSKHGLREGFQTVFAEVRAPDGDVVTTGRFPDEVSRISDAVQGAAPKVRLSANP